MTDQEFLSGLDSDKFHYAENILAQRDDALKGVNSTIDSLNARIASLSTQLAGASGRYIVTVSLLEDLALSVEATSQNVQVSDLILSSAAPLIEGVVTRNTDKIVEQAIEKYQTLDQPTKDTLITFLGLGKYIPLAEEERVVVLKALGVDAFKALSPTDQTTLLTQLGF